ncbi:hypothetical protein L1987_24799 [Smallanthus sonchifolius]|uniref:Uncharacterized protein n=1 Tax=Smallanthus sonchifolius TaxID=185202 RepID=A0ACB9IL89_9ASTR|nr:hypothetical protein L1987_24799 [Smallanthus sonchifolius]
MDHYPGVETSYNNHPQSNTLAFLHLVLQRSHRPDRRHWVERDEMEMFHWRGVGSSDRVVWSPEREVVAWFLLPDKSFLGVEKMKIGGMEKVEREVEREG